MNNCVHEKEKSPLLGEGLGITGVASSIDSGDQDPVRHPYHLEEPPPKERLFRCCLRARRQSEQRAGSFVNPFSW